MNANIPIALIDDDPAWRESLAEYFSGKGFVVHTADNGARGLALLEKTGIRVAVIDLHMPVMDGLELLHQLSRRRLLVGVLVVSSDDEPDVAARVLAAGALAFLSKTASPRFILDAVRQALRFLDRTAAHSRRLLTGPRRVTRCLPAPKSIPLPRPA
jgi:DNA-binding NarL/FixJ family response regulator